MVPHALSLPPSCPLLRTALLGSSRAPPSCCFSNRPMASVFVRAPMLGASFLGVPRRRHTRSICSSANSVEEKDGSPQTESGSDETTQVTGLQLQMDVFKDTARVFFAAFLWMALFFWASAWDGQNSGRPPGRPRFRK